MKDSNLSEYLDDPTKIFKDLSESNPELSQKFSNFATSSSKHFQDWAEANPQMAEAMNEAKYQFMESDAYTIGGEQWSHRKEDWGQKLESVKKAHEKAVNISERTQKHLDDNFDRMDTVDLDEGDTDTNAHAGGSGGGQYDPT